jgi:hypothetical protein
MQRLLFWALVALTLTTYAAMLTWSLPTLSAAAGGLAPFDMRPGGYGLAEAEAFLRALTPDGRHFYKTVQHRLDIAYPGLLALTLFLAIVGAAPRRFGLWRYALATPAIGVAVFDWFENAAVAGMLRAGVDGLTGAMVASASTWTVLKSGATTLTMTILVGLLFLKAGTALRRRIGGGRRPAMSPS